MSNRSNPGSFEGRPLAAAARVRLENRNIALFGANRDDSLIWVLTQNIARKGLIELAINIRAVSGTDRTLTHEDLWVFITVAVIRIVLWYLTVITWLDLIRFNSGWSWKHLWLTVSSIWLTLLTSAKLSQCLSHGSTYSNSRYSAWQSGAQAGHVRLKSRDGFE